MTLGLADRQGGLLNVAVARCEAELPERSIYRLLHAERDWLFGDELFADLYVQHGRRSVPPSILAVVMVLHRLEGCSDREAVDRFAYDLRWRYAAAWMTRWGPSRIPCWWSCVPGCAPPPIRIGFSG
jgi:Transposase domain (DUF772)